MNIILTGVKGVGKTTYGKQLAEIIGSRFIDTDREIELNYKQRTGESLSCREITQYQGEVYFRALESEIIESLVDMKSAVIALGGGALLSEKNRLIVSNLGKVVCLYLDFFEVKRRWDKSSPLGKGESEFQELYDNRMEGIRQLACTWLKPDANTIEILKGMAYGK